MRWTLGLLPVAAGGGWASLEWLGAPTRRVEDDGGEPDGPVDARTRAEQWTRDAAWLCFARHPDTSVTLADALEAVESYAPAHLVNACWFMEQGEWELARKELSSDSLRDTPEARLLRELADRQPRSRSWRHAFFEAWSALGRLVTLEWKQPPSERFFLQVRERFEGVLLLPAHHARMLATSAQGTSLGRALLLRARASAAHLNEDERRWMGRLLWEVGARLREQRSRLELEVGLKIQMYGSELTGHSPTRMDSISLWVELGEWEQAQKRAAWMRWPLATMQEESCEPRARDEHAWLKAFAGKGELP